MSRPTSVPDEGSIQPGKVIRIEPYGAFVELDNFYRLRGLVHISKLANFKVEQVSDVVAENDAVWVKVLQVEEQSAAAGPSGQTRYKISLSLKDASQDGQGTDLGAQAAQQHALSEQIQRSLHSNIGMAFAVDPMAAHQKQLHQKSNLILKNQPQQKTVINGYALVDDDDEEEEDPLQQQARAKEEPLVSASATTTAAARKPMGRGRGTTLPAWMTRQDGPIKTTTTSDNHQTKSNDDTKRASSPSSSASTSSSRRRKSSSRKRKKEKHRRKRDDRKRTHSRHPSRSSSKSRSRRHRHRSDDDNDDDDDVGGSEEGRHTKHTRRRRRRRRSRSQSPRRKTYKKEEDKEDSSSSSKSLSSSRRHSKKRSRTDDHRKKKNHQSGGSTSGRIEFQSTEEAQRLIERLESKRTSQSK